MTFESIELYHVSMPLISPWRTAYGQDDAIHSVLCKVTSSGVEAWGESCPLAAPTYSSEWAGGLFATARDWFAPHLLGQPLPTSNDLQARLAIFKGNPFAKGLFDSAWWSLKAKQTNQPLHKLWGATRDRVPVGADFGVEDDIDTLLEKIDQAVKAGFSRVKLKFKPGWDVPMVAAVRKAFPNLPMHVDCNTSYTLADLPVFQALDDLNLTMIEQPLSHDDLHDHAKLQQAIRTPVCLDESISSLARAKQAIELGSCRVINIKPGRVGGFTVARQIHDLCKEHGITAWVGGMLESALGGSMCASLAMLDHFTYPPDVFPTSRFYEEDLCDPPTHLIKLADGSMGVEAPRELPEPVMDRLEAWTLADAVLEC